jgi:hypothetical protein
MLRLRTCPQVGRDSTACLKMGDNPAQMSNWLLLSVPGLIRHIRAHPPATVFTALYKPYCGVKHGRFECVVSSLHPPYSFTPVVSQFHAVHVHIMSRLPLVLSVYR